MCYIRGEIEVSPAGKMPDDVPSRKAAVSVSALGIFLQNQLEQSDGNILVHTPVLVKEIVTIYSNILFYKLRGLYPYASKTTC